MNAETGRYRDERLGAALRELEVPEHGNAFFAELEVRLRTSQGERRPRRGRVALGLAAAVAAAVVAVAIGLPYLRSGADVARAAAVRAQVLEAVGSVRTIRGRLLYTAVDPHTGGRAVTRASFAADDRGDFRLTTIGGVGDIGYEAARGIERAVTTSASIGAGRFFAERRGLAPGPPDAGPSDFILDRQLGAAVRALAAARDPKVKDVRHDGRPAWRLDTTVRPNTIAPDSDRLRITVDKETRFPVDVLATLHGRFRSRLRLERLAINQPLSAAALQVRFPHGAPVLRTDAGFRRVTRGEVAGVVGYPPLVPAAVPAGFGLAAIAVANAAAATGPGQSNPPSRNVVSLSYRRGLDDLIVTTRARVSGRWRDPFAAEGVELASEPVTLTGALAHARAEVVVDPRATPHLWALTDRLVVTVSGDVDRADLIAVAQSLR